MRYLMIVASSLVMGIAPGHATAQDRGTSAQQDANARQAADLHARLDAVRGRIGTAQRDRSLTQSHAEQLRRQVGQINRGMTQSVRRQGFVSAGEFASYERMLGTVEAAIGDGGVSRAYGNDALPSAEVLAFQRMDARLSYRDARIDYVWDGCALYTGVDQSGQARRERLLNPEGQPICVRR